MSLSKRLQPLPLRQRKVDVIIVAYLLFNLLTHDFGMVIEGLVIDNPADFSYPLWPPAAYVDFLHDFGRRYDPLSLARPAWWRAFLWIELLLFTPYHLLATYAFVRGRRWIRIPTIKYASARLLEMTVILFAQWQGAHPSPNLPVIILAVSPYVIVPLLMLQRMAPSERLFLPATESD